MAMQLLRSSITALLLCAALTVSAQDKTAFTWYFGSAGGLSFAADTVLPVPAPTMAAGGGTAVVSDPVTGKVLFYTDGSTVWNAAGTVVKSDVCASCTSATQSAVIVPYPGREGKYYLFTTSDQSSYPNGEARVSLIEVAGSTVVVGDPERIVQGVTEKVTAIKACNGSDYWVVFKMVSGQFRSYRVKFAAGFDTTSLVVTDGMIPLSSADQVGGEMKISPDGKMLVAVNESAGIELYRFNNATGQLTNIERWGVGTRHYGCSFSPNSKLLYVGRGGTEPTEARQILQYDVTAAQVSATVDVIGATAFGYAPGGMQLAPNGRLYIARPSSTVLAGIMAPNTRGRTCGFVDSHINIPGATVGWDLPNFPQQLFTTLFSGRDTVICARQPIRLGRPPVPGYSYTWTPAEFLDDFTFAQPTAVISANTTFTVVATDQLGCQTVQTVSVVIIPPAKIKVSQDTTVCAGTTATLRASGGVRYQWRQAPGLVNASSATPQVTPQRTTTYVVDVVDSIGCVATDSVRVYVSPDPDIRYEGRDTTVCIGEPAVLGRPAVSGLRYEWTPAALLDDATSAQPTARLSQTTTFRLRVIDPKRGCEVLRQVTVTAVPRPNISLTQDTAICVGESVGLRVSGGLVYRWSPSTGLSDTTQPNVIANPAVTTRYVVAVTGATGCTASDTVTVTVRDRPAPVIEAPKGVICSCDSIEILAPPGFVSYVWSNGRVGPRLVVREAGSYFVRVTDRLGCEGVSNTVRLDSTFVRADVALTLSAPAARDGQRVVLGIELRNARDVASCLGDEVRFVVGMTPKVLVPVGRTVSYDMWMTRTFIDVKAALTEASDRILLEVPCTVTLGGAEAATIAVDKLTDGACDVAVQGDSVTFTLDEICRIGGIPRLFNDGVFEGIVISIGPNPASDVATVRLLADRPCPLSITVHDVTGRTVYGAATSVEAGWTQIDVPVSDLGGGLYVVRVAGAGVSAASLMEVYR
ncbi:MAG: hypothetical protein FGM24_04580 [Candidatus Kapabacteria bacterium]|nr:hypothetical protein [Candidatus Kapabacteria bacterium]